MPQKGSKANNRITMTYAQALNAWKAMAVPTKDSEGNVIIEPLIQRKKMDVVRVKVPFRRFFRQLEEHREDFVKHQEEMMDKFIQEKEELDEDSDLPLLATYPEFVEQYQSLLDTEVHISGNPIKPEVFEGADVTILDLEMLGPLVDL